MGGNRHFWAQGYYVSTVGLNKATIKKYIQEQEIEDKVQDKRSLKEYKNLEELEKDIKEYIEYYNNKRIKSKLKGMSPIEYRKHSMLVA